MSNTQLHQCKYTRILSVLSYNILFLMRNIPGICCTPSSRFPLCGIFLDQFCRFGSEVESPPGLSAGLADQQSGRAEEWGVMWGVGVGGEWPTGPRVWVPLLYSDSDDCSKKLSLFLIFCCGGVWPGRGWQGVNRQCCHNFRQGGPRHGKAWQGCWNRKWDLSKEWDLT